MAVKLEKEDMKYVIELYNAITSAMSKMPHEIMSNTRYGAWAANALVNVLCNVIKIMNLDKSKLHQLIDDIWDQDPGYKVLN